MPRSQKSKHRARARRSKARGEAQPCEDAKATAAVEGESTPSSSPLCEDTAQSLPTTGSRGTSQQRGRAEPTPATSEALAGTRSDEDSSNQGEEAESLKDTSLYSENALTRKAVLLEQFLLHKFKMKQAILKPDMLRIIGPNYEERFPELLKKAAESIEIVFGADVQEIDSTRQLYDLICKLSLPNNGRVRPGKGLPKTSLLMNILGLIFLNDNCIPEEAMWKFLSMVQVYPGRKHFIYGEPRKLITKDLVRMQYLEYRQVSNSDPPRYELLWGPKALVETTKTKILKFLSKVNNSIPTVFPTDYEKMLREQEERAEARGATRAGATVKAHIPASVMARRDLPRLMKSQVSRPPDKKMQQQSKN
ncbi:melanoma-associated antigen B5-like [Suricata suricatta]|uniref:melanoma-associated antigen B5-like n=1 Tax=Suricata suricatta TaxID=37032 RepID=UPI001155E191|nr:melanoma-associated antigen B5-like [Suricata suricatta]